MPLLQAVQVLVGSIGLAERLFTIPFKNADHYQIEFLMPLLFVLPIILNI